MDTVVEQEARRSVIVTRPDGSTFEDVLLGYDGPGGTIAKFQDHDSVFIAPNSAGQEHLIHQVHDKRTGVRFRHTYFR